MNKTICIHGSSSFYEIPLIELFLNHQLKVIWINHFSNFDKSQLQHSNLCYIDLVSRDSSCILDLQYKLPKDFLEIEVLINTECAGTKECQDTWDIGENLIRTVNVTSAVIPLLKNSKFDPKVININFMNGNHHLDHVISHPLVFTFIDTYRNGIKKENVAFREFAFDTKDFDVEVINLEKLKGIAKLVLH